MAATTRHTAEFLGGTTLVVEITSPSAGDTITTATPTITWAYGPGTQSTFRVLLATDPEPLEDEDYASEDVIYDSGVTASSVKSHQLPEGAMLNGETLYVTVLVTTTDGQSGIGDIVCFDTAFAPSVAVENVQVEVIGDECDGSFTELPCNVITWDEVTPGVGETFQRYSVRRRVAGSGVAGWKRIAVVSEVDTTTFTDYCVQPGVGYEYAVTWTALVTGPAYLTSSVQDPPTPAIANYDWLFIHVVGDPDSFVRFDSWDADIALLQDVGTFQTWGRQRPTAIIGEVETRRAVVPAIDRWYKDREPWDDLRALVTKQRTNGAIFCARFGRHEELLFCQIERPRRQLRQKTYGQDIALVEVYYDDTV